MTESGEIVAAPELTMVWVDPQGDPDALSTLGMYFEAVSELPFRCEFIVVADRPPGAEIADVMRTTAADHIDCLALELHAEPETSSVMRAALDSSSGAYIAFLPSYLQVVPSDLVKVVSKAREGFDYVASWRRHRVDARRHAWLSRGFNWLTRRVSGVPLHDVNSGMRVVRREVLERIPFHGDLARFFPVLAARQGFRVTEVEVTHLQERVARGDYRPSAWVSRLLDLLTLFFLVKFTQKPLRFFGITGSISLSVGTMTTLIVVTQRFLQWGGALSSRPALLLGVLMIVLGVQLLSVGLLGELITFTRAKSMRHFEVERVHRMRQEESRVATGNSDIDTYSRTH